MKKYFYLALLIALTATTVLHAGTNPVQWNSGFFNRDFVLENPSNDLNYFPGDYSLQNSDGERIRRFSVSVNPLGFLQFGPMINAEFGVIDHLGINAHIRLTTLGLLSYAIRSSDGGVDELSGMAFGGGPIFYTGSDRSKFYAGFLMEFESTKAVYSKYSPWEWWENEDIIVFALNGGYRFLFSSGFFINAGAYLGAYRSEYNWYHSDPALGSGGGGDIKPFGMLEVSLGFSF